MIVENHTVYRVVPFEAKVKEGDSALPSKLGNMGLLKQRLEDTMEKHRPKVFPRREDCLFVCFSKDNAYEWATIKYGHKTIPYKLLTLEVSGNLFWLKAGCYNGLQEADFQNKLDDACINYWNSEVEDECRLTLDNEYEGLFVGENKIKAIEYKNYINGESYDIE